MPGTKLAEVETAARLGISRNTLREAFRLLDTQKLITHIPNRGVFVRDQTLADVLDIYRARLAIEPAIVRTFPANGKSLRALDEHVQRAQAAGRGGDWIEVGTQNAGFHSAIVHIAGSPTLDAFHSDLMVRLRLIFDVLSDPEYLHRPYLDQNAEIAALLRAGNADAAAASLTGYLESSQALALSAYAERSREGREDSSDS